MKRPRRIDYRELGIAEYEKDLKKYIEYKESTVDLVSVMDMLKTIKSTVDKIRADTKKRDYFGGPG